MCEGRYTTYAIRYASVAELADAQGLGPCVLSDVEVRLLSLAVFAKEPVLKELLV